MTRSAKPSLKACPTDRSPTPARSCATSPIGGLDRTDPRKVIALRGRIHAAARTAAEGCQTTYHATETAVTIGNRGPGAEDRINQLRYALAKLITKHGWTTRDQPR